MPLTVLPPFCSYAKTDAAVRWRLPWPLVEVLRSSERDRISVWPIWEQVRGYSYAGTSGAKGAAERLKGPVEERTWRFGWQLVESTDLETKNTLEKRFNFFPFFTRERRWRKGELVDDYMRIWPFYSSETVNGRTRRRMLELMPVRHVEGIERNWAPYWSLWESEDRPDGRTRYSIFFNFIAWQTDAPEASAAAPAEKGD